MNLFRMVDSSSNNGSPDLRAHWKAGFRVWMRKVSEGTTYFWNAGAALADLWHRLGGIVWHYHYLKSGHSGRAQADWFWNNSHRQIRRYDRIVVDVEAMGNNWLRGEANKCAQDFIQRMHELAPGVAGVVYGTSYFLREQGVTPHRGWSLMIAAYPNVPFVPTGWKTWLAHQFTQTGRAAGFSGAVDISEIRRLAIRPSLRKGDRVFSVRDAKRLLKKAGYGGTLPTMTYGSGMVRAVAKYKRDHHLSNRDGNVFGRTMWRRLG